MKARVITTITTLVDVETMQSEHKVDVNDEDGLSEVSGELLAAVLVGACRATEAGIRKQFPATDRSAERLDAAEQTDEETEENDS